MPSDRPFPPQGRWFTVLVYAVQFFFGGWFLFHGANYFLAFFKQPPGSSPLTHEVISALIHSGLFGIVKAIEIAVGIALLANRFVPLAAVAAFPVSFSIAYVNFVANGDGLSLLVAAVVIAFNAIIAIGHMGRFWPMLSFNQGDPDMQGLFAPWAGNNPTLPRSAGLNGFAHLLCILAGLAAPAGLTLLTTKSGGVRGAEHYAQVAREMDPRDVLLAYAKAQAKQPGEGGSAKAFLAPGFADHGAAGDALPGLISAISPDQVVEAGDLAIVYRSRGGMDIFRVAEGKIAERWTVNPPAPSAVKP